MYLSKCVFVIILYVFLSFIHFCRMLLSSSFFICSKIVFFHRLQFVEILLSMFVSLFHFPSNALLLFVHTKSILTIRMRSMLFSLYLLHNAHNSFSSILGFYKIFIYVLMNVTRKQIKTSLFN